MNIEPIVIALGAFVLAPFAVICTLAAFAALVAHNNLTKAESKS